MKAFFSRKSTRLSRFFDPGAWLVAVLIPHTVFGSIIPLLQSDPGSTSFESASYALVNSAVLLAILLFCEGTARARMTTVVGGSVFAWILVMSLFAESGGLELSAELAPPFIYRFSINVDLAPPMALWGFLTLSGLMHWNDRQVVEEE